MSVDFSKSTLFIDIPEWNSGQTIWDKGSNKNIIKQQDKIIPKIIK
jgi:hypothetical protein